MILNRSLLVGSMYLSSTCGWPIGQSGTVACRRGGRNAKGPFCYSLTLP